MRSKGKLRCLSKMRKGTKRLVGAVLVPLSAEGAHWVSPSDEALVALAVTAAVVVAGPCWQRCS